MLSPQGFQYPVTPASLTPFGPSSVLRFRVVTWNMAGNKYSKEEWKSDILRNWSFITAMDYDCLAVCLQEDNRGKYNQLGDAIGTILAKDFTMVSHSVEGPPEITGLAFSVRAYLFLRKTIFINPGIKTLDVCFRRTIYCSKSTAGIAILVKLGSDFFQVILMSSHLPLETSSPDLGYDERIKSTQKTMEEVFDRLVDPTVNARIAFWAGDLNFRNKTPVTPKGPPMADQLEYAFSVRPSKFWREFAEPEVDFPPTCKLARCRDSECPVCRRRTGGSFTPGCYDTIAESGKVKTREPSHCDRILYRGDNVEGSIGEYRSWSDSKLVQHSDHNLVTATFGVVLNQ